MDIEKLTKKQIVFLVLLVSFFTSLVTGIVTVTLINQAPPPLTQTIQRVIEKTIPFKPEPVPAALAPTQEELVVGIVKNISDAVVSVVATKDLPVVEQYFVNPFGDDEFFKQFFPEGVLPQLQIPQYRQKGTEKRQISSGSGFFVSSDGLIATNRHVVEDASAEYSVIMNDGKKLKAEVLARDPLQDIAILKVEGNDFRFISLGDSDALNVGQTVIAIGNSLGEFQNTVSLGVISGLHRTITASGALSGPESLREVIQTDAAINPGNSGGPLLDLRGMAIGINTAMAQGAENVGFALPINAVKKDIKDVQANGKISYPFLGVRYVIINKEIKQKENLKVDYGALITTDQKGMPAVFPGSPAEKAGLKEGDIILEFDKIRVDANNTLANIIRKRSAGDVAELKIIRGEQEMTVSVTLEEFPENPSE